MSIDIILLVLLLLDPFDLLNWVKFYLILFFYIWSVTHTFHSTVVHHCGVNMHIKSYESVIVCKSLFSDKYGTPLSSNIYFAARMTYRKRHSHGWIRIKWFYVHYGSRKAIQLFKRFVHKCRLPWCYRP